jgi:predicted N-formylglutamate amidohydrolase
MHADRDAPDAPDALLSRGDPPPFEFLPGSSADYLIVCDHAACAIPWALGALGLSDRELSTHIAIDIGARFVAKHIAERLHAPALIAGYSRLVIDCNRYPWDPASITPESDRTPIPGNLGLSAAERTARVDALFLPYHRAISTALDALMERGARPIFLSIHSCTPRLNGESRPWHIGLSYREPDALALRMLEALRHDPHLTVGDNQPYLLEPAIDYTTPEHALRRRLPYLQVEFRQDLIASQTDAREWAEHFIDSLSSLPRTGAASPAEWVPSWSVPHWNTGADLLAPPA